MFSAAAQGLPWKSLGSAKQEAGQARINMELHETMREGHHDPTQVAETTSNLSLTSPALRTIGESLQHASRRAAATLACVTRSSQPSKGTGASTLEGGGSAQPGWQEKRNAPSSCVVHHARTVVNERKQQKERTDDAKRTLSKCHTCSGEKCSERGDSARESLVCRLSRRRSARQGDGVPFATRSLKGKPPRAAWRSHLRNAFGGPRGGESSCSTSQATRGGNHQTQGASFVRLGFLTPSSGPSDLRRDGANTSPNCHQETQQRATHSS